MEAASLSRLSTQKRGSRAVLRIEGIKLARTIQLVWLSRTSGRVRT